MKILVLVGPTSSGKSELAIKLAKKLNGEIISCDSRQVYRGMNLGTGKVAGNWKILPIASHPERVHSSAGSLTKLVFVYKSIVHHCIDYVNPIRQYNPSLFKRNAEKAIKDIVSRGKLPILCGGTAQYINAVIYDQTFPEVKPNPKLRISLEKKSVDDLYQRLLKLDPARASTIDRHNKRRLIRALEIIAATRKPVPALSIPEFSLLGSTSQSENIRDPEPGKALDPGSEAGMTHYDALWLGIKTDRSDLYKKIDLRLKQRLKAGMIEEVEQLHNGFRVLPRQIPRSSALSWKRLQSFGLEYRYLSLFLQKKLSSDEMFTQLSYAIKHYSKRQLTWWKKNEDIIWISNYKQAEKVTKKFL